MEIYIVRHGETIWNKEKKLQGRTDIELSDYGREVAVLTGEGMKDIEINHIFCSPLKRAQMTAKLIRGDRDIEITVCDALKELSFGHFEGQNFSMLIKEKVETFDHFFKEPHLYRAPADGETLEHLIERAGEFMQTVIEPLANDDSIKRVMIVAHGALNKAIASYIKKHDLKYFWTGGVQKNCSVMIVDYTDGKYNFIDETKLFYE